MKALQYIFSHAPSRAVATLFLCNGFFFGSWATRIPEVKHVFDLSEQSLGFVLLAIAIGSLTIMPFMARIGNRLGAGKASVLLCTLFGLLLPLPLLMPSQSYLMAILFIMGIGMGGMDIAMNTAAAMIEEQEDVRIMSAFHGFWSLGAMLGAWIGSISYGASIPYSSHMAVVVSLFLLLVFSQRNQYFSISETQPNEDDPSFILPGKNLWVLAIVALLVFLAEGAIADWSALYMTHNLQAKASYAGFGYSAFALMMAVGRFYGDEITEKLGPSNILIGGNILVAVSIGALLLLAHPWIAILGFAVAGFGFSAVVPVVFSEAAKTPGMSTAANMAAIGSVGYFGFLAGPPMIGFVAETLSLPKALGILALASLFSAILIKVALKPKTTND